MPSGYRADGRVTIKALSCRKTPKRGHRDSVDAVLNAQYVGKQELSVTTHDFNRNIVSRIGHTTHVFNHLNVPFILTTIPIDHSVY